MGTTMTAERALGLREKAQERFQQLENEMKGGQSDPEAWEMARRAVEFYERQAEILKVKEAEEAERQAQLKLEQKRREEARADLPRLDEQITAAENLSASLLDAMDVCRKHDQAAFPFVLSVFVDTLLPEIKSGPDRGGLDAIRWADVPNKQRDVLDDLRKQRTKAKATLEGEKG